MRRPVEMDQKTIRVELYWTSEDDTYSWCLGLDSQFTPVVTSSHQKKFWNPDDTLNIVVFLHFGKNHLKSF